MLMVKPKEHLAFPQSGNREATIELSCKSTVALIYKIQTTSPEKFRVRPRHGLIEPKQSVSINILLRQECCLGDTTKDKFLVLCVPAPLDKDLSTLAGIADAWKEKNTNCPKVEQHRLTCLYQDESESLGFVQNSNNNNSANNKEKTVKLDAPTRSSTTVTDLIDQTYRLEKQLKFTQFMQYFTLFILLLLSVAVVYLLRLEMDFSFILYSSSSNRPPRASKYKSVPLTKRISNSFSNMRPFGRKHNH